MLLLVAVTLAAAGSATRAVASAQAQLPFAHVGQLLVDDAHNEVFLTGWPAGGQPEDASEIAVMKFDGTQATDITGEPGATGMALSGGKLYVAGCGTTTIDVFDTATLAKVDTITTSHPIHGPCQLVIQGGRLWLNEQVSAGDVEVTSVALAAPHNEGHISTPGSAYFAADPSNPGRLVIIFNTAPAMLSEWDISTAPATELGSAFDVPITPSMNGATMTADGSDLLTLLNGVTALKLPGFTEDNGYLMTSKTQSEESLAIASDGTLVAMGGQRGDGRAAIDLWHANTPGSAASNLTYNDEAFPVIGAANAVGFSSDKSRAFVAIDTDSGSVLYVDTNVAKSSVDIDNFETTAFDKVVPGTKTKLTGSLHALDGASVSGKTVQLSEQRPDGSAVSLPSAITDSTGDFQSGLTEALNQEGVYTFTSRYSGDATHLPAEETTTLQVEKIGSGLSLTAVPASALPGQTTNLTGTLIHLDQSSTSGLTVHLSEQGPGGVTTALGDATTDADGAFQWGPSAAFPAAGTYTFTASYDGDATHAAANSTARVTVALIATHLTLGVGRTAVVYGRSTTVTARLSGAPGGTVRITQVVGKDEIEIASGPVAADGTFSVKVTPTRNTTYRAYYDGDPAHASSSDYNGVAVMPIILGKLSRGYGSSGKYRLFRYTSACRSQGSGCPSFTEKVYPNLGGSYVYLVVERHTSSGWKVDATWKKRLNSQSSAKFKMRYGSTKVIGKSFRAIAVFLGNNHYHRVAWGAWYFKVTR